MRHFLFILFIFNFSVYSTFDTCFFTVVKNDLLQKFIELKDQKKTGLPSDKYSYFISESYQEVLNKYEVEVRERQEQRILKIEELDLVPNYKTFELDVNMPLNEKLSFFYGNSLQLHIHEEIIKILSQVYELKKRNTEDEFFYYVEEVTTKFITKILEYNNSKDTAKAFSNLDLCYNYLYLGLEIEGYLGMIEFSTI